MTTRPEQDVKAEADLAAHAAKSVSQAHGTVKPADVDPATVGTGSTQVAAGNDARFPTVGQKNALAGSQGTPGTGNEYVTKQDPAQSNARAPTAHTHPESDVTGLVADLAATEKAANKGVASGYAGLGLNGSLAPLGTTGAVAATRYVGGTAAGAPTSGTFAVGDFVVDQVGTVWVCTVAGTPGTWASATGGELQYAERTSDTAALGPAVADIGVSITFTPTTTQIRLLLEIPLLTKNVSAGWVLAYIADNANGLVGRKAVTISTAGGFGGLTVNKKLTGLTPGAAVTYKGRIQCQADTVTISGGSIDIRPFIQAFTL